MHKGLYAQNNFGYRGEILLTKDKLILFSKIFRRKSWKALQNILKAGVKYSVNVLQWCTLFLAKSQDILYPISNWKLHISTKTFYLDNTASQKYNSMTFYAIWYHLESSHGLHKASILFILKESHMKFRSISAKYRDFVKKGVKQCHHICIPTMTFCGSFLRKYSFDTFRKSICFRPGWTRAFTKR